MLRKVMEELRGRRLIAADGLVGTLEDVYFDRAWTVRYLVVHREHRFLGQRLLIAPKSISGASHTSHGISVAFTASEVKNTPGITLDVPVQPDVAEEHPILESALRSVRELTGYSIAAQDGFIGHIRDFVIDDDGWYVIEIIADTRSWLPGHSALVSPDAVDCIRWKERAVRIRLTREDLERSPRMPS
jgi:hypothetical protein